MSCDCLKQCFSHMRDGPFSPYAVKCVQQLLCIFMQNQLLCRLIIQMQYSDLTFYVKQFHASDRSRVAISVVNAMQRFSSRAHKWNKQFSLHAHK